MFKLSHHLYLNRLLIELLTHFFLLRAVAKAIQWNNIMNWELFSFIIKLLSDTLFYVLWELFSFISIYFELKNVE